MGVVNIWYVATCSYSEVLTPNINPTFSKTYNPHLNLPIKSQFSRDFEEQLSSSYESVIIYVIECAEVLVQICLELVLLTLKGLRDIQVNLNIPLTRRLPCPPNKIIHFYISTRELITLKWSSYVSFSAY